MRITTSRTVAPNPHASSTVYLGAINGVNNKEVIDFCAVITVTHHPANGWVSQTAESCP